MDQQTVTLIIAIWGAVVATGVGIWDIVKWKRSGARLRVFANANMKSTVPNDNNEYILVRVENIGDASTTLKILAYRNFKKKPFWFRLSRPSGVGFFNTLNSNPAVLPYKIDPGTEWTHILPLGVEVKEMAKAGYFYLVVEDTMTNSAYKYPSTRLIIKNERTED